MVHDRPDLASGIRRADQEIVGDRGEAGDLEYDNIPGLFLARGFERDQALLSRIERLDSLPINDFGNYFGWIYNR
jgi:hypothetical protein